MSLKSKCAVGSSSGLLSCCALKNSMEGPILEQKFILMVRRTFFKCNVMCRKYLFKIAERTSNKFLPVWLDSIQGLAECPVLWVCRLVENIFSRSTCLFSSESGTLGPCPEFFFVPLVFLVLLLITILVAFSLQS